MPVPFDGPLTNLDAELHGTRHYRWRIWSWSQSQK